MFINAEVGSFERIRKTLWLLVYPIIIFFARRLTFSNMNRHSFS